MDKIKKNMVRHDFYLSQNDLQKLDVFRSKIGIISRSAFLRFAISELIRKLESDCNLFKINNKINSIKRKINRV
jgi:hypothetical protein